MGEVIGKEVLPLAFNVLFSLCSFLVSAKVYSLFFGVSVKVLVPLTVKSVMSRTARHIISD